MNIKIDSYIHQLSCKPGDHVKVYAVPANYSEDGVFVACFRHGEIEPAPACLGCDAHLVADVTAGTDKDGLPVYSGYMAEGVEINA